VSIAVAVQKHGELVVAADTLTTFGNTKVPHQLHAAQKIRRAGGSWLATTGWGLYDNILQDHLARGKSPRLETEPQIFDFFLKLWKALHRKYTLVNDQIEEKESGPFGNMDSTFLVANRRGIFYVAPDLSVTTVERYFAIGSGAPFALGALHALYDGKLGAAELARKAVEAAIDFDNYCGGAVVAHSVKLG
jgi:ATP-dependent protease HslVU (ClpYQ) peptidase subunit